MDCVFWLMSRRNLNADAADAGSTVSVAAVVVVNQPGRCSWQILSLRLQRFRLLPWQLEGHVDVKVMPVEISSAGRRTWSFTTLELLSPQQPKDARNLSTLATAGVQATTAVLSWMAQVSSQNSPQESRHTVESTPQCRLESPLATSFSSLEGDRLHRSALAAKATTYVNH